MSKRLDLETLCNEARAKGLNVNEIEIMKRHYNTAMLNYIHNTEPKPGVQGAIEYLDMQVWVAYVAGASYVRQTIDAIQRGDKK